MLCIRSVSALARRASTFVSSVSENSPSDSSYARSEAGADVNNIPADGTNQDNLTEEASTKNTKQARYAFLLCYHGEKYLGIQYNIYGPSIEGEFFKALTKAGFLDGIDDNNSIVFHTQFSRASRTDRGVSALRQVVALKLPQSTSVEKINSFLPDDIKVLGIKRTTRGFDARVHCESRSYCYIMPSFAFCLRRNIPERVETYRTDADTLTKANEIFKMYEGSHRFHNYTEKRDHWDQRSVRKIIECSVSDAFLIGDMEMVELHITGFSFMLHQIRRMVGMTIALMVGRFPDRVLKESLEHSSMPTPTAPSLGLILEKQYFDKYNRNFGHREPMVWDEYDNEVEKFKLEKIVPHIVAIEREERSMERFMSEKLRRHSLGTDESHNKFSTLEDWNKYNLEEIDEMLADESIKDDK